MNKVLKIMKCVMFFCVLLVLFACNNKNKQNELKENSICPYKKHVFELSNFDESKIGFPKEDEFEIGPNSVCLHGDNVYFINPLFSKIECFNLKTDLRFSSISFSKLNNSNYSWVPTINDLVVFNEKLYVLNGTENIYVLNTRLELIKTINSNCSDKKEFYKIQDKNLVIFCYNDNKFICIDENDNLTNHIEIEDFNLESISSTYFGEKYEINRVENITYFVTSHGKIKLNEEIQDITMKYYQCKNFGFNSRYFLHFAIEPKENKITFFSYCF